MDTYDAESRAWGKNGYNFPAPASLAAAKAALAADPLASAAMKIRMLGNEAYYAERQSSEGAA
jgi:hypothetical protein